MKVTQKKKSHLQGFLFLERTKLKKKKLSFFLKHKKKGKKVKKGKKNNLRLMSNQTPPELEADKKLLELLYSRESK